MLGCGIGGGGESKGEVGRPMGVPGDSAPGDSASVPPEIGPTWGRGIGIRTAAPPREAWSAACKSKSSSSSPAEE